MKKSIFFCLCFPLVAFSNSGRLFNITYSPTNEGRITLNISSNIPNRSYRYAGITIPNGYSFMNNSCPNQQGQTCVFSVSNTSPVQLTISGPSGVINNTLCLNQNYHLNCEVSIVQYLSNVINAGGTSALPGTTTTYGAIYSGINNSNWSLYSPAALTNNQFKASFCSNSGQNCIVSGFYGLSNSNYVPAVFYSNDQGVSWTSANVSSMVSGLSNPIQVWSMGCNAATGYCMAGGNGSSLGYLWYSNDFGRTWSEGYQQPSNNVLINQATICYHSNTLNQDRCVVVGANSGNTAITVGYGHSNAIPMTLTNSQISPLNNYLNVPMGVTCSSNDRCVLVGYLMQANNTTLQKSVIYYSTDGGVNWTQSDIATPGPSDAQVINLSDVSCDITGQKCIAAGWYSTSAARSPAYGLVYVSTDGGVNWNQTTYLQPPSADSNVNRMNAVECAPYSGVCTVSGRGGNNTARTTIPISYISYDYGQTWSNASVMPLADGANTGLFTVALFGSIVPVN